MYGEALDKISSALNLLKNDIKVEDEQHNFKMSFLSYKFISVTK